MPKTDYVVFSTHITGHKLEWLCQNLTSRKIQWKLEPVGMAGPMLCLHYKDFVEAAEILNQEIGSLNIGDFKILWRDLPDDHPLFKEVVDSGLAVSVAGEDIMLPKMTVPIHAYDVESSNVSAIGVDSSRDTYAAVFVRFKGGVWYRYAPVDYKTWDLLLRELTLKEKNDPTASVGAQVNRLLKDPADHGQVKCYKLDDENEWRRVPPKHGS